MRGSEERVREKVDEEEKVGDKRPSSEDI